MIIAALPGLKIHHVSISVPDMEAALKWYADILGFQKEFRFSIDALSAEGAFMVRDGLRIELWAVKDAGKVPEVLQAARSSSYSMKSGWPSTAKSDVLIPERQT
jgi:catechol 2,3-dioxygenase-like lactoylglutathione lyase family enzyme